MKVSAGNHKKLGIVFRAMRTESKDFKQDDGVVGSGFRKVIWIYCVEFLEMTTVETWEQVMARW